MTDGEKAAWVELRASMPWLKGSHRVLVRLTCILIAKMESGDLSPTETRCLATQLGKLGATPVDESRVTEPEDDPSSEFFH
jgi:hypothetical protein